MSDSHDPNAPAKPLVESSKPSRRGIVSAVWLVPIMAIVIALAIAWQSWSDRGVLITVTFPDASGVTIGQTNLRYREVTVGVVEDVGFTGDLSRVNVYIRVNQDIAPYLDDDASFWVVQPEVTARGVQGLNTILSGTYIEGTWDNEIGLSRTTFEGDERAPIVPPGVDGTAIVLRARDSSRLGPGAPILYRGIEVGEVSTPRLSPDGTEVRVDAFILAPYDRQLSTATRFWDSSGVSATLGTSGVDLRIGSIASILEGGVNFDTLISGGEAIESGHVFNIFADETAARASTFETPTNRTVRLSAIFPSAAAGLSTGASVRYQGVTVGTVAEITGFIRPDDPNQEVQLLAVMALQPSKMGLETLTDDLTAIDFIDGLVENGMRAKLVSTSILGGDLAIDMVNDPDLAGQENLQIGIAANPLIPTLESDIQGLTASAESVLTRINELPIEELLSSATTLLDNVNRIAGSPETRAIPGEALALIEDGRGLVRDGRGIISSPQVASVLLDIETVTSDLRDLTQSVTERDMVGTLDTALTAATEAATNIAAGTETLPDLSASASRVMAEAETLAQGLTQLSDKANALALDELVNAATKLMTTADLFLSSDEAGDVPVVLSATLEELRVTLETIRTGGTIDNLNSTLRSTAAAADSVRVASGDLPALVNQLQTLARDATAMLGAYGEGSRVNTELYQALRAATRAAEDVSSLSRTIERNPNSLLLGR